MANENLTRLLSLCCFLLVLHQDAISSFLPSLDHAEVWKGDTLRCGSYIFFSSIFLTDPVCFVRSSFCWVFLSTHGLLDHRRCMLMYVHKQVGVFKLEFSPLSRRNVMSNVSCCLVLLMYCMIHVNMSQALFGTAFLKLAYKLSRLI